MSAPQNAPLSLLSNPWTIAFAFAPFAMAIWALQTRALGLDPEIWAVALQFVKVAMLAVGLALFLAGGRPDLNAPIGRHGRWTLAALAALIAIASSAAAIEPRLRPDLDFTLALARLIDLVIFVALAEEIWFRGLWMRAANGNLALALGVGSIAFGLFHWHLGALTVLATTAIGALYGAARWRGAPIWALALAHGFVNWTLGVALLGTPRFDVTTSFALVAGLASLGAALILFIFRKPGRDTA